ncbi:MAG: hypothetical protein KatS3mg131_1433 [Candidatus Tectimicrobiota bacterium]|nr:MAG: hypothetical protein KatS3mg131_1433 [Candidatus Tectomicrobia bacterium]
MEITKELRELAKFSGGTLPVVSVYLDTQWRDQHQREQVLTFLTRHLRQARLLTLEQAEAQASLDADLARLEAWQEKLRHRTLEVTAPGYALFACNGAGLWVELPAPVPFENEFTIAERPALRQLARLDEDYTNALVVLVDSRAARVCEVVLGGLLSETAFNAEVPGRHKQGGWAQMRYQRHVKDHIDRHHKEVADYLIACLQRQPHARLILAGPEEVRANFRRFLPPAVQPQVLEAASLDLHAPETRIVEVARQVLERHEREEEQATVELLLSRAARGGLAVVGRQETLAAANTGRVHKLVMHRDLRHPGWRCTACGWLGEEAPPAACPACGGTPAAVDLGEALVARVLALDGEVELIAPDPRLAAYEGVGALLRYK